MNPSRAYLSTSVKGKTVLGLTLASAVVGELECLNILLQKKTQTVSGMQDAVDCVRSYLQGKRNDKSHLELYEKATSLVNSIKLVDPIETANSRRLLAKQWIITGQSSSKYWIVWRFSLVSVSTKTV